MAKKAAPKKAVKKAATKRKPSVAFMAPKQPDAVLAAVDGKPLFKQG